MDGLQGSLAEGSMSLEAFLPSLVPVAELAPTVGALALSRLAGSDTLLITKTAPGFDAASVAALRRIVDDAAHDRLGPLKFIAFDFAHRGEGDAAAAEGFHALVSEAANLILKAPVVTVAFARGHMQGADMEFALACNMMVAEPRARFLFAGDPIVSIATYGFLAQKLGFVRAERLMEQLEELDVEEMQALLLVKDMGEHGQGLSGLERYLDRTARRHNSCYGIYRAQRIAAPAVDASRPIGDYV